MSKSTPNHKEIELISANIRGFYSKRLIIEHLLTQSPKIAVFTKTHFDAKTASTHINILNYSVELCSRVPNHKKSCGGGVCIFYPSDLNCRVITKSSNIIFEALTIIIKNKKQDDIMITALYRPPGYCNQFPNKFAEYLSTLPCNMKHIITGDFNLPDIDWFNLTSKSNVNISFLDHISHYGLFQNVFTPTRGIVRFQSRVFRLRDLFPVL